MHRSNIAKFRMNKFDGERSDLVLSIKISILKNENVFEQCCTYVEKIHITIPLPTVEIVMRTK